VSQGLRLLTYSWISLTLFAPIIKLKLNDYNIAHFWFGVQKSANSIVKKYGCQNQIILGRLKKGN
jgi:hypothetical protein